MPKDARARDAIEALDRLTVQRFADQERALNAALASAEKAVLKAEAAAERRFEGVNEFRGMLADQAARLATRSEMEAKFDSAHLTIAALSKQIDIAAGRGAGAAGLWGYIVGGVGLLALIASLLWKLIAP